jgi:hypothetical protein
LIETLNRLERRVDLALKHCPLIGGQQPIRSANQQAAQLDQLVLNICQRRLLHSGCGTLPADALKLCPQFHNLAADDFGGDKARRIVAGPIDPLARGQPRQRLLSAGRITPVITLQAAGAASC